MNRLSLTASRLAIAAMIGLASQTALGDESPADADRMPASERPFSAEQIEAQARAHREALQRRLAEELADKLKEIKAPRVDLVLAADSTRG